MKNVAHDTSKDPRLIDIGNRIKSLRIEKGYSSAEIFAYEHDKPCELLAYGAW